MEIPHDFLEEDLDDFPSSTCDLRRAHALLAGGGLSRQALERVGDRREADRVAGAA